MYHICTPAPWATQFINQFTSPQTCTDSLFLFLWISMGDHPFLESLSGALSLTQKHIRVAEEPFSQLCPKDAIISLLTAPPPILWVFCLVLWLRKPWGSRLLLAWLSLSQLLLRNEGKHHSGIHNRKYFTHIRSVAVASLLQTSRSGHLGSFHNSPSSWGPMFAFQGHSRTRQQAQQHKHLSSLCHAAKVQQHSFARTK